MSKRKKKAAGSWLGNAGREGGGVTARVVGLECECK